MAESTTRAGCTRGGDAFEWWDKWIIDGIVRERAGHPRAERLIPCACCERGLVQWYALVMVVGLLGFGVYYMWK